MNSFGDLPKSVPFEKSKLHCFHGPVEGALAQPALYKRLLQGQIFCLYRRIASAASGLISTQGLPKRTPRARAASIPSRCRCRMFSRSFSAANDKTCSTRSAMNVPSRSLLRVVSSSGISITLMSALISLVMQRHCSMISSESCRAGRCS